MWKMIVASVILVAAASHAQAHDVNNFPWHDTTWCFDLEHSDVEKSEYIVSKECALQNVLTFRSTRGADFNMGLEGGCLLMEGRWVDERKTFVGLFDCNGEAHRIINSIEISSPEKGRLRFEYKGYLQSPVGVDVTPYDHIIANKDKLSNVSTSSLKFVLGVGEAGLQDRWKGDRQIAHIVQLVRDELRRRDEQATKGKAVRRI